MKRVVTVLGFLFCLMFYPNLYARNEGIERDSLSVFEIQDLELAAIFDNFIDQAQNLDLEGAVFWTVFSRDDSIILVDLDVRKQPELSDSLILYKNPHFYLALVRHRNVLFRAYIDFSATSHPMLKKMLRALPQKQSVYMKDPPSGYYDLNLRGGDPLRDTLLESFWFYYDNKEWREGLYIDYIDDTLEFYKIDEK